MRLESGKQIRGPTRHYGAKVEGCKRHCIEMCSVV